MFALTRLRGLAAAALLLAAVVPAVARGPVPDGIAVAELPHAARATLLLIREGGRFPFDRDGVVFGNYEQRLPAQARGYYREYTVPTPGVRHRGAQRIVAGGCDRGDAQGQRPPERRTAPCPAGTFYYTADHYRTFRRILE
ncbi:MAG: ribonuclease domain-containing protein [Burkholderiales bacterium]